MVVVGRVNQLRELVLQGCHQTRVVVPQGIDSDAAQRIQIAFAIDIPHAAALAM